MVFGYKITAVFNAEFFDDAAASGFAFVINIADVLPGNDKWRMKAVLFVF